MTWGVITPGRPAAAAAVVAAVGYAGLESTWSLLRVLDVGPSTWPWTVAVRCALVALGLGIAAAAAADRAAGPAAMPPGRPPRASRQLLAVLLLFPLAAAMRAVGFLINGYWGHRPPAAWVGALVPGHPGLTTVLGVAADLGEIGAALGLVAVLLRSAGEPGLAALGLDMRRRELDVARALPLLLGATLLPLVLGHLALSQAGVAGLNPAVSGHPLYALVEAADAVDAGLVEEVCLLGFLVWCGRRAGWSTGRIVLLAVVARTCFHLYYGWGVLPLLAWALLTVLAFLWFPPARVAPFVLVHWCYDLGQTFGPGAWLVAPYLVLTVAWVHAVHQAAKRHPDEPARWFLLPTLVRAQGAEESP